MSVQLIAGPLPRVEILGLTAIGAEAVKAAAGAIAAGGDEQAAARAALGAARGVPPDEERLCADLVALRDRAAGLLDALPVEEHIRFCDRCWHADELSAGCPEGSALSARVSRLEKALGR